jgi:hypothetical protein
MIPRELIEKMVNDMVLRIENEVPVEGGFEDIHVGFVNPDSTLVAERYWLEVVMPPDGIDNRERLRGLMFVAKRRSSGAVVEVMLASGSKEMILEKLKSPGLITRLMGSARNLSYNLIDLD